MPQSRATSHRRSVNRLAVGGVLMAALAWTAFASSQDDSPAAPSTVAVADLPARQLVLAEQILESLRSMPGRATIADRRDAILRVRAARLAVARTREDRVAACTWAVTELESILEVERAMVRTGRAVDVLPTLDDPRHTLWPIPQGELDVAPNLVQNPGY